MTGELTGAADLATGALLGRAFEPGAGEHVHGAHDGGICLNCGTARVGEFCHACGQNGHVHKTLASIGHDLLHGVFHFEGKIWRTLPMLALHPGALTRRYIAGERARFVSPMAMFLFSVFLLFAVVANLPGWHFGEGAFMKGGLNQGFVEARAKLADQRRVAEASAAKSQQAIARLQRQKPDEDTEEDLSDAKEKLATAEKQVAQIATAQKALPPLGADEADDGFSSSSSWIEEKYRHAKENPQLLLYKIKSSAYKYSWALIPISLPFIWLLFPFRRDVGFYDHAIFATYSLSFMSLLFTLLAVLGAIGLSSGALALAWVVIPSFHIYRQLRGAYRLGRLAALWKTVWMLIFTVFTVTTFVLLLIYLGTAG